MAKQIKCKVCGAIIRGAYAKTLRKYELCSLHRPDHLVCQATTQSGARCRHLIEDGGKHCKTHSQHKTNGNKATNELTAYWYQYLKDAHDKQTITKNKDLNHLFTSLFAIEEFARGCNQDGDVCFAKVDGKWRIAFGKLNVEDGWETNDYPTGETLDGVCIDFFSWVIKFLASKKTRVNYYEYIASPEWKQKASEAKERVGYRCQLCNKEGTDYTLNAHHRTYERLGDELFEDITVLCRDCHAKFHDKLPE